MGYAFGSGNYFSWPQLRKQGAGAGGETKYNCIEHITFVVTSNAARDAIFSVNDGGAVDGGPLLFLQNNAGALRLFIGELGSYSSIGTAVIGKRHTVSITYSDISPYPTKIFLDGRLVQTVNKYLFSGFSIASTYIGSGYPSQTNNAVILQYYFEQPGNWSDVDIKDYADNPWGIFARRDRSTIINLGASGGSLAAAASGSDTASGAATLAAQVAIAGVGVSVVGGSAQAGVAVPLSAAGILVAGGSANGIATISIKAAGLAQAAGQAGLSASVLLAAAGAAQAAGNATLAAKLNALASGAAQASGSANLTGGAPGALIANGGDVASGAAVASVSVQLQATGAAQSSGSANGTASAPGAISASGRANASGFATWSALVTLTAAGFVQAMGAGSFNVDIPLAASGLAQAGGSAQAVLGGLVNRFSMQAREKRLTEAAASVLRISLLETDVARLTRMVHEVKHV